MRLQSADGAFLELSVKGYQFARSSEPRDWDANWLAVAGVVVLPEGTRWTFEDPCLTTWEARELADWLCQVHGGHVQPSDGDSDEEGMLVFTEPNLALSLAARSDDSATIGVHVSLKSGPASREEEIAHHLVVLDVPMTTVSDALSAWTSELRAFPVR